MFRCAARGIAKVRFGIAQSNGHLTELVRISLRYVFSDKPLDALAKRKAIALLSR
jgi:hypothetical protein